MQFTGAVAFLLRMFGAGEKGSHSAPTLSRLPGRKRRNRADDIFHPVVADLNLTAFKECAKIFPPVTGIDQDGGSERDGVLLKLGNML